MATHEPGPSIFMHNVAFVHRRQGVRLALLKEYLSHLDNHSDCPGYQLERMLLVTR
ncbi:hypothetical protein IEO21_08741 [Rhodonia placenta]|uniref:Uncharacterized protein n=1 Tax=Rhodonia placenta TaxID=104341 RepID=A0A8H7TZ40_9APHY|nr:hypothetical protein IEO21_08741 [Postia placenta]